MFKRKFKISGKLSYEMTSYQCFVAYLIHSMKLKCGITNNTFVLNSLVLIFLINYGRNAIVVENKD